MMALKERRGTYSDICETTMVAFAVAWICPLPKRKHIEIVWIKDDTYSLICVTTGTIGFALVAWICPSGICVTTGLALVAWICPSEIWVTTVFAEAAVGWPSDCWLTLAEVAEAAVGWPSAAVLIPPPTVQGMTWMRTAWHCPPMD